MKKILKAKHSVLDCFVSGNEAKRYDVVFFTNDAIDTDYVLQIRVQDRATSLFVIACVYRRGSLIACNSSQFRVIKAQGRYFAKSFDFMNLCLILKV